MTRNFRKRKTNDKKRCAYASGSKKLKMNDARQPEAKSQRQKTPCVGVRRQKAENERCAAAESEKSTTKKRFAYASGGKRLKMNDNPQPRADKEKCRVWSDSLALVPGIFRRSLFAFGSPCGGTVSCRPLSAYTPHSSGRWISGPPPPVPPVPPVPAPPG